jgi:D-3-phosphoglycerate dehydrogenase
VAGVADGFPHAVAGTLANGEQRLVRLDDYELEMAPAPWMLVTRHQDRPGMMGRIGVMLGEADINISAMHLGRSAPRSDAFMLLALDEAVPVDVAGHIRAMDGVLDIWSVELGGGA